MVHFNKNHFPQQTVAIKGKRTLDSGSIASGMAFWEGQLEKIDPKLREPLSRTWWARDIVAKTGGGFVEYTSAYDVSYATTGGNSNGMIGGETNELPIMQADISKEIYKVFNWGHVLRVPFIDQQKLQKIGRFSPLYSRKNRNNPTILLQKISRKKSSSHIPQLLQSQRLPKTISTDFSGS